MPSLFRGEVSAAKRQRVYGEIVLTQPVRARAMVLLICTIASILTAWVTLGTYTRTETARGILVTSEGAAKIVGIRPGQVTGLYVKEGDLVRPGQRIASIRVEQSNEAGGSAVGETLTSLDAQRELSRQQIDLARRRAVSEQERVAATLAGLRRQRRDVQAQIGLQTETVASTRDMFERIQSLLGEGFVSRVEVERRRQAWLASRQELARLEQQLGSIAADEARAEADIGRIAASSGSEVATARATGETLAQQRSRLQSERSYMIAAPISGRVAALQTAVGRTVDPSMPMMVIVPEGTALRAELYAPTRAVGFVQPGQEVRLLYDAFPYQRFGSHTGRITRVSRTAIDPRELSVPLRTEEAVYRIEVEPLAQSVDAFGTRQPLQPGMALSAAIILDRRTFLEWLLTPINAVLRRNH